MVVRGAMQAGMVGVTTFHALTVALLRSGAGIEKLHVGIDGSDEAKDSSGFQRAFGLGSHWL